MIPTLGLMVAVYAIARLVQVPLESWETKQRWWLLLVSLPAIAIIGILAVPLVTSGTSLPAGLTELGGADEVSTASAAEDSEWDERLRRYVVAAGEPCPRVTRAIPQGVRADGANTWGVFCTDGHAYTIGFTTGQPPRIVRATR